MEQETQQKKSLLIIKSHAQGLGPAENFLRNRGWEIKATANLKEALVYLVQSQPQFVMISIDHPNRKVRNLPKVLVQAFPVCVIAFSETASAANIKILSETSAEYAIFPPITGPAIERTVNKYYKDLQTKALNPQRDSSWEGAGDGGSIAIRGSAAGGESAQNILAQFLAGDGDSMGVGGSGTGNDAIGMNSGSNANNTNSATMASGSAANMNSATMASGSGKVAGNATQGNVAGVAGKAPLGQKNPSGIGYMPSHDNSESYGAKSKPTLASSTDSEGSGYSPRQAKKDGPGWAPVLPKEKSKERPGPETFDDNAVVKNQDSLISKGARDALEKSCINFKDDVLVIKESTNVACILVESARFSGYLIAAMAKDKVMDLVFVEKIRSKLFRFLRENGESVEDSESMSVKVREVPFEDWALEQAEFLRKSVHNGEEIAMAFFPRRDLKAKLLDCADSEMAAIHIDELSANVPVEFNVYIYLPRNNKYLLYTPCGGTFFGTQKDRLVNQGVSHLHILRLETSGLDKYRAQNFLNDRIQQFEAKEREKVIV